MIECRQITLRYRDRVVLHDFSTAITTGTIAAIVGANGVGKSTLLAAIAGDIAASCGVIEVGGRDVTRLNVKELAQLRSLAQQSHNYWLSYSTQEIVVLGYESIEAARVERYIEKLGIDKYLNQAITTLSGGQLQRVEMARALIADVPLVLLDEPFASQDLDSIQSIRELLIEERAQGRTILLVAHARGEDLSWCDQMIEIR
jgi:iron complex transport system ATP-binding protein